LQRTCCGLRSVVQARLRSEQLASQEPISFVPRGEQLSVRCSSQDFADRAEQVTPDDRIVSWLDAESGMFVRDAPDHRQQPFDVVDVCGVREQRSGEVDAS
jgi:hypothetical protein